MVILFSVLSHLALPTTTNLLSYNKLAQFLFGGGGGVCVCKKTNVSVSCFFAGIITNLLVSVLCKSVVYCFFSSVSRYYDQLAAIENKLPIAENQVCTTNTMQDMIAMQLH